jgi:hypothetical protein
MGDEAAGFKSVILAQAGIHAEFVNHAVYGSPLSRG